jgi:HSP20 family molecular chaperone IbpA
MTKPPTSYDEITRRLVPDPDSSFHPSPEQVKQAYEGFRALDPEEQQLHDRVRTAISASGLDVEHVDIEVDRDRVTVRGKVRTPETAARISERVRSVEGVGELADQLVIDTP